MKAVWKRNNGKIISDDCRKVFHEQISHWERAAKRVDEAKK